MRLKKLFIIVRVLRDAKLPKLIQIKLAFIRLKNNKKKKSNRYLGESFFFLINSNKFYNFLFINEL